MKALFTAVQLLGDLVEIMGPLRSWIKQNPDYEVEVRVQDQQFCEIIEGKYPWGEIKKIPGDFENIRIPKDIDNYDFFHNFDIVKASKLAWGKNIHISEGYAELLGVELDHKYGFLAPLPPPRDIKDKFIAIAPFAGGADKLKKGGSERSLQFDIWNKIIQKLLQEYEVFVFGFSKSPWKLFNKLVPNRKGLHKISEESILKTVSTIISDNCVGLLAPDSGVLHCISAAVPQVEKQNFCSFVFLTDVIPKNVNWPFGLDQTKIMFHRDFCGNIKFDDIREKIINLKSSIIYSQYPYRR